MRINADFSRKAVVVPGEADWVRSPESGVDRVMLDRIGEEVARATSIVRYAPGSAFSRHEHAAGEEFLVLDGVFSDEHGDYASGTYVRNPPGSGHSPYSDSGCRILVKLRQFDPNDGSHVVVDTSDAAAWLDANGTRRNILKLHEFGSERVMMVRLAKGESFPIVADPGGVEVFVINGSIADDESELGPDAWIRFPAYQENRLVGVSDSLLWVKTGHLPS